MAIEFAGIPLLLGDPEGHFQAWIDRNLSLDDIRLFGAEPTARVCTRNQPRSSEPTHVGLSLPNWPTPPRPKINTLWWPVTGASRWAVGYFLADTDTVNRLYDATGNANEGTLTLSDGTTTVSGTMYMLAPRMLSAMDTNGIWLVPLVDQRYFWQFLDCGQLVVDLSDAVESNWTTWSDVIDQIQQQLDTTIAYNEPAAAYKYPDMTELTRQYENLAVLLDAVAASVGQRVVASGDTISLVDVEDSEAALTANTADTSTLLAGGNSPDLEGLLPEKIQVIFSKTINWSLGVFGDVYSLTKAGSSYCDGINMPTGTLKTIFDTAPANFGGNYIDLASDPENKSVLDALAGQIATDYYGWLKHVYDYAWIGLKSWTATGYDDYVWYHIGHQYPQTATTNDPEHDVDANPGNYACFTRVASLPYDFGVVNMMHGLGSLIEREFYNVAATTCPRYGVAAVTTIKTMGSGKIIAQVDRPSSSYVKQYVVSQYATPTTSTGEYQNDGELVRVLYGTGTPAVGELWGPTEGQWYVSKGSTGNGDSNTTTTRADWGVVVVGIVDSTNKVLLGRVVSYGMAKRCKCQLKGTLAATDASVTVDNVTTTGIGWAPVAATSTELTAYNQRNPSNTGGFAGDDNAVSKIEWDETAERWELYDVPCTA